MPRASPCRRPVRLRPCLTERDREHDGLGHLGFPVVDDADREGRRRHPGRAGGVGRERRGPHGGEVHACCTDVAAGRRRVVGAARGGSPWLHEIVQICVGHRGGVLPGRERDGHDRGPRALVHGRRRDNRVGEVFRIVVEDGVRHVVRVLDGRVRHGAGHPHDVVGLGDAAACFVRNRPPDLRVAPRFVTSVVGKTTWNAPGDAARSSRSIAAAARKCRNDGASGP